jgi:hypothetical protein
MKEDDVRLTAREWGMGWERERGRERVPVVVNCRTTLVNHYSDVGCRAKGTGTGANGNGPHIDDYVSDVISRIEVERVERVDTGNFRDERCIQHLSLTLALNSQSCNDHSQPMSSLLTG